MLIDQKKQRGILLVDDSCDTLEILEELLKAEGYQKIITTSGGAKAVSILASQGEEIYLVLLDILMPEMSGIDVMQHLANIHKYPVGIIVLTCLDRDETKKEIFEMGTDTVIPMEYITKPFKTSNLLWEIDTTLESIHSIRMEQTEISSSLLFRRIIKFETQLDNIVAQLSEIKSQLPEIKSDLSYINRKQQGFLAQLGLELIKAIIVAIAVIALIYLGVSDFIRNIIQNIR
ncbi:MAG: response regulator transcription factor [Candidatus Brocadiales bacterium]|nr:response regulator transcription factor [Candidatus Brocadiales bacterium]